MTRKLLVSIATAAAVLLSAGAASAQMPPDPAPRIAAQTEAMKKLSMMDGTWRGSAWTATPGGKHELTQTERVGPLLGGAVKVVEGRGYNADGSTSFNALAIVSFEPDTGAYTLHSHAMGRKGDFKLAPTGDGFVWEVPAGPMTIRYTATIKDGTWTEIGERVVPGQAPVKFFEMNLKRLGDTTWPAAGAVGLK